MSYLHPALVPGRSSDHVSDEEVQRSEVTHEIGREMTSLTVTTVIVEEEVGMFTKPPRNCAALVNNTYTLFGVAKDIIGATIVVDGGISLYPSFRVRGEG